MITFVIMATFVFVAAFAIVATFAIVAVSIIVLGVMSADCLPLVGLQDINVRKNQQMLSSFFFSACEVLKSGDPSAQLQRAASRCTCCPSNFQDDLCSSPKQRLCQNRYHFCSYEFMCYSSMPSYKIFICACLVTYTMRL